MRLRICPISSTTYFSLSIPLLSHNAMRFSLCTMRAFKNGRLFYGWYQFYVSCQDQAPNGLTTSILWPNYTLLILNRGGEICSLLQTGQRPGVLRRVRFLKEKPHCWQEAGSTVKPLWCTDFSIWLRWSRTSFSLIPNNFEISRKSRDSPSKVSAIFFLKVDILSIFKLTTEFYQTLLIDWPNCSMT